MTPCTVAHQAPLSMEFSRQVYWSGLPFPSLETPKAESKLKTQPKPIEMLEGKRHLRPPILHKCLQRRWRKDYMEEREPDRQVWTDEEAVEQQHHLGSASSTWTSQKPHRFSFNSHKPWKQIRQTKQAVVLSSTRWSTLVCYPLHNKIP